MMRKADISKEQMSRDQGDLQEVLFWLIDTMYAEKGVKFREAFFVMSGRKLNAADLVNWRDRKKVPITVRTLLPIVVMLRQYRDSLRSAGEEDYELQVKLATQIGQISGMYVRHFGQIDSLPFEAVTRFAENLFSQWRIIGVRAPSDNYERNWFSRRFLNAAVARCLDVGDKSSGKNKGDGVADLLLSVAFNGTAEDLVSFATEANESTSVAKSCLRLVRENSADFQKFTMGVTPRLTALLVDAIEGSQASDRVEPPTKGGNHTVSITPIFIKDIGGRTLEATIGSDGDIDVRKEVYRNADLPNKIIIEMPKDKPLVRIRCEIKGEKGTRGLNVQMTSLEESLDFKLTSSKVEEFNLDKGTIEYVDLKHGETLELKISPKKSNSTAFALELVFIAKEV